MADIFLMRQGKALLPVNDSDAEAIQKLKHGAVYKADITAPRNLRFHRKSFALLNIAFQYWQPETFVSEIEKQTVEMFSKYLTHHGMSNEAISALSCGFVDYLEKHRQQYEGERDFESFRAWITVKSGFFHTVHTPAGLRKVPKSISFASMEDVDFANYYKAILNTCWLICLNRVFESQDVLMNELLRFE